MDNLQPSIICSDMKSMSDAQVSIKVQGLQPQTIYTIHSFTRSATENLFECVVRYKADENGSIELDTSEALGGNYIGVEPMGIFWSMEPSPTNKNTYARFVKLDVTTPLVVTVEVYQCEIDNTVQLHEMDDGNSLAKNKVASIAINRLYMAPGTRRIPLTVEEHGIHGTLFIPRGEGPFPALITMFGSHPGTMDYKASLLASHGFVSLALAFFGVPGTPKLFSDSDGDNTIRLEYFERAVNFLLGTEKVEKACGVGVMVLSFTGFIGLAMATYLPGVRCVICQNAISYVTFVTLLYKDKIFPPYEWDVENDSFSYNKAVPYRYFCPTFNTSFSTTVPPSEDSNIKFYERKDVSYMFVASLSDLNTPSENYTNLAHKLLQAAKHPSYEILRYPGAGHLLEPPYIPHNRMTAVKGTFGPQTLFDWGGETIAHCKAQEHAWKQQIGFLRRKLGKRSHL